MLPFYVAILVAGAVVAAVGLIKKTSFRYYIADGVCMLLLATLPTMLTYLHLTLLQSSGIIIAICTCVFFFFPVWQNKMAGMSQILIHDGAAVSTVPTQQPAQEQDPSPVHIANYQQTSAASSADDFLRQLDAFANPMPAEVSQATPMQGSEQDQMQAAMQALVQEPEQNQPQVPAQDQTQGAVQAFAQVPVQAFAQTVQAPAESAVLVEMDMSAMMGMIDPQNVVPMQNSEEVVQDFSTPGSVEQTEDTPPQLWSREDLLTRLKEMEGGEIDEDQMLFGDLLKNHPSVPMSIPSDPANISASDLLNAGMQMSQNDFEVQSAPPSDVQEQGFDLNAALAQLNANMGQQIAPMGESLMGDPSILPELTQQPAENAGVPEEGNVLGNLEINLNGDGQMSANGVYSQQMQPAADETMQVNPEQVIDMPLSEEMLSYVMVDPPPVENPPSLDELFSAFEGDESAKGDSSVQGSYTQQGAADTDAQENDQRDLSKELSEIMAKLNAVEDIIRQKNNALPIDPMEHYFTQNNYHFNDEPIELKSFLTQTGNIVLRRYQLPRMDDPILNHAASAQLFNDALHFSEVNQPEQAEMLLRHLCLTSVDSELSNRSFFIAKEMLIKKNQLKELEDLVSGMIAKEKNLLSAMKDIQTMFGQSN